MSVLDGWLHRVRVLWRRDEYAREQASEVRFHLDLEAAARRRDSGNEIEAELAARRAFGNVTVVREDMRAATPLAWLDRLERNVTYALRSLRRSPGFSATVIVTIALGVGANATMFSILDRLLLRPPPGVAAPQALRRLYIDPGYAVTDRGSTVFPHFSYPNFAAVRDAWRASEGASSASTQLVAYAGPDSLGLGEDGAAPVRLAYVTANYFSALGVRPIVGRVFGDDEAAVESPTPVMVISERLWRSAFGGDAGVIGRRVRVGRLPLTIVGIVPSEFTGLAASAGDAWIPLNNFSGQRISGGGPPWYQTDGNYLSVVARLGRGVNEARLISTGGAALRDVETRARGRGSSAMLLGPIIEARGPAEKSSELELTTRIAAIAVIVLIIACANVANLMLTRASARAREIAVRRALGASRARLYEQLLTESIVLALLGGALAIGLAAWGGSALHRLLFPAQHWVGPMTDWRMLGFCALVVLLVGIAAGLAPALMSGKADVVASLRSGSTERGYRRSKLGAALLALQAALCVMLLVGSGLLLRSRANVAAIKLGVDADHIVFAGLPATPERVYGAEAVPALAQVAESMRGFAGVEVTALASFPPMGGLAFTRMFRPNGDSIVKLAGEYPSFDDVSPDYFRAAGIKLLGGRLITRADGPNAAHVMVVSREMARLAWPGQSPIGQCLIMGKRDASCTIVVGVVEDTHRMSVIEGPSVQLYRSLAQSTVSHSPTIVVRAEPKRLAAVANELRMRVARAFPEAPFVTTRPLPELLDPQVRSWRIGADLFTAFGMLAVLVAAVGIYSLVAYGVAQRTHEMGVRIALGADTRSILDLVIGEAMTVVGAGIAIGVLAALLLGRFIASLLFGVTATDLATMLGAVAVLLAVGITASMLPAWRGARVDAMVALRSD